MCIESEYMCRLWGQDLIIESTQKIDLYSDSGAQLRYFPRTDKLSFTMKLVCGVVIVSHDGGRGIVFLWTFIA